MNPLFLFYRSEYNGNIVERSYSFPDQSFNIKVSIGFFFHQIPFIDNHHDAFVILFGQMEYVDVLTLNAGLAGAPPQPVSPCAMTQAASAKGVSFAVQVAARAHGRSRGGALGRGQRVLRWAVVGRVSSVPGMARL